MASLSKNFIHDSLFQIGNIFIPFLTIPYLARVLGPEGVGIYSFYNSLQFYCLLFIILGTSAYGIKEISQSRDNIEERSILFSHIILIKIINTVIFTAIWFLMSYYDKLHSPIYLALYPNIIAAMLDISWLYFGLEDFKLPVYSNLFCKSALAAYVFMFIKSPNDLLLYMIATALAMLFANVIPWYFVKEYVVIIRPDRLTLVLHFKKAFVYFIPSIATSLYTVLDKTLLGFLTKDMIQVGYYDQANKLIAVAKILTFTSINSIMGTRIPYLFKTKQISEIHKLIGFSMNYIFFMGFGFVFGILGLARIIVPLIFGSAFIDIIVPVYWMAPIIVIIGISNCLGSHYYTPNNKRAESTRYIMIGSTVNLIINIMLIPIFNIYGVIASSIIAESIITFLYVVHCREFINFYNLWTYAKNKLIAAIVMYFILYNTQGLYGTNIYVTIISQIVLAVIVYCGILLLLKDDWFKGNTTLLIKKIGIG